VTNVQDSPAEGSPVLARAVRRSHRVPVHPAATRLSATARTSLNNVFTDADHTVGDVHEDTLQLDEPQEMSAEVAEALESLHVPENDLSDILAPLPMEQRDALPPLPVGRRSRRSVAAVPVARRRRSERIASIRPREVEIPEEVVAAVPVRRRKTITLVGHKKNILHLLNNGTRRELVKNLMCMGAKHAAIIVNYRSLYGNLKSLDDVHTVFEETNFAQRFLKANLC